MAHSDFTKLGRLQAGLIKILRCQFFAKIFLAGNQKSTLFIEPNKIGTQFENYRI